MGIVDIYLLAVLAGPVAGETGWPNEWIIAALSLGLLISGLGSPRVGHFIERYGGGPVLAASAVLLALGLLVQGFAPNLPVFILAWVLVGLGMSAGLYDPSVLHSGPSLRRTRAERYLPAHLVWRLCQYGLLATERVFWSSTSDGAAPASPTPGSTLASCCRSTCSACRGRNGACLRRDHRRPMSADHAAAPKIATLSSL